MTAAISGVTVTVRVECPHCSARYEQRLFRRPRGLFLPPSQCGSCTAAWPHITEIRVELAAGTQDEETTR
jgi:hypothetical protein